MRSRSDRDRELQLSWAHTVTLIHTDINFRVTDSVATFSDQRSSVVDSVDSTVGTICISLSHINSGIAIIY